MLKRVIFIAAFAMLAILPAAVFAHGLPPVGPPEGLFYADGVLYELRDGRISAVREYFDSLYVRKLYSDKELGA